MKDTWLQELFALLPMKDRELLLFWTFSYCSFNDVDGYIAVPSLGLVQPKF